jgi:hypothetical protein
MTRSVVTVCTPAMADLLVAHLPKDIKLSAQFEHFDKNGMAMRFEGDGLPEWAEHKGFMEHYAHAYVRIDGDGVTRFTSVEEVLGPEKKDILEWLKEQFKHKN